MTAPVDEALRSESGRHFVRDGHGPSRRWMIVFSSLMALVLAAAAVLTYVGIDTVRTSRAGKSVSNITDPALPGFEAFLEPTPTLVVLHSSGSTLVSATVLALHSGDVGGSVLLVSPDTRLSPDEGAFPLAAVAAFGGSVEAVVPGLQDLLDVGLAEVAVVDDARWAELVAPVAPLTLDNPDAVGAFAAGPIALAADQVGPYLAARVEGESDLARLFRQQLFFEAWASAVAASTDPAAVPGEVESGIGRFVRGLAAGPREIATVPVVETVTPEGTAIDIDRDAANELVSRLIPFPTASRPGGRVRVRLLDGTGDPQHVLTTAPLLAPAGAQIVVVGNADRFDYGASEIRYHDPTRKAAAEALREALGAGQVVDDPRQTDAFDVTIVLGPDV
ncbi:MAG: LytR C-terminal domain-containing protein [Acidimicrobiales bacterium]